MLFDSAYSSAADHFRTPISTNVRIPLTGTARTSHQRVRKDPIRSHRVLIHNEKQRAPIGSSPLRCADNRDNEILVPRSKRCPRKGAFHHSTDTGSCGPRLAPCTEPERAGTGGADRDRTGDPLLAKQVLSQLSYSPRSGSRVRFRTHRIPSILRSHARGIGGPGKI
jgi:hypothetical protein